MFIALEVVFSRLSRQPELFPPRVLHDPVPPAGLAHVDSKVDVGEDALLLAEALQVALAKKPGQGAAGAAQDGLGMGDGLA